MDAEISKLFILTGIMSLSFLYLHILDVPVLFLLISTCSCSSTVESNFVFS